jgi:hypothetical protein
MDETVKFTMAVAHRVSFWSAVTVIDGVSIGRMVIVALDVAVVGKAQAALLVSWLDMISPAAGRYTKVLPEPPDTTPFTFHSYTGAEPPLVGIAVNVTGDDVAHSTVPGLAEIVTDGVSAGLTITGHVVEAVPHPLVTL